MPTDSYLLAYVFDAMVDTANKHLITLQIPTPASLHGVIEKSAFSEIIPYFL